MGSSLDALKGRHVAPTAKKVQSDGPGERAVETPKKEVKVAAEQKQKEGRGRKPLNGERMSDTEYKRRWRAKKKAGLI